VPPHNIAKVDESQQGCVAVARGIGAFVFLTHQVGKGFPDAVIGYRGNLYLIEFKTGKGKLEEDQAEFAQKMDAVGVTVHVVRNPNEMLALLAGRMADEVLE